MVMEREEVERRKLQKVMMENKLERIKEERGGVMEDSKKKNNQVLRITRTFKNGSGREFTRTELVRKQNVIENYIKIRNTKDDTFIRNFATMDDEVKEEMKKERRRIQEQLRRIKRNQEKEKLGIQKTSK